ncbi:hypothetical protein JCM1841_000260 [Sporobolomyces salmonicolor]
MLQFLTSRPPASKRGPSHHLHLTAVCAELVHYDGDAFLPLIAGSQIPDDSLYKDLVNVVRERTTTPAVTANPLSYEVDIAFSGEASRLTYTPYGSILTRCFRHSPFVSRALGWHLLPPTSKDLTETVDAEVDGALATLKETINDIVFKHCLFSSEATRVSLDVGTMGPLGGQGVGTGVEGNLRTLMETVNTMATQLTFHFTVQCRIGEWNLDQV